MSGIRVDRVADRPYLDGGRDPAVGGLDCYGLARAALADLGVEIPAEPAEGLALEAELGRELDASEPTREGDLLVIESDRGPHVGVALSRFRFVHATREAGVAVGRIGVWMRSGKVRRRVRLRALEGVGFDARG
jgi:cell wall-associated NlpC family hydrolase